MMVNKLLRDRSVVVTGAGRGLGEAFAIAIASEGAAVVVNDLDREEAERVVASIEAFGGRAVVSSDSVATAAGAEAIIDCCVDELGRIDGLVNNAVAYPYFGPPWDETDESIRQAIEVNVIGALSCGVHAMRHMRSQGAGSIINLASRAMQGIPGASTYSAAKGAMVSATYSWAIEMEPYGVRVNALAPGARTRAHDLSGAVGRYAASDAIAPSRIAPAAVYLLSDLSGGVHGQVLALVGTKLGVVRPANVVAIDDRDDWTAESIAEAFTAELHQPVGLAAAVASAAMRPN